jgi:L-malate glycosyltransferase
MKKPRILHVFSTFEAGGPQVRVCRMISCWGDRVEHVIAAHDGRYLAKSLLPAGAPVTFAQGVPFNSRWALGGYLRRTKFDLICTYNWGAMDVVFANRFLAQRPLVHHDEGFGADEVVRQNPKRILYRRLAYPGAAKIVTVSRNLETIAATVWRQSKDRIVYLPNGINVADFSGGPQPNAIPGYTRKAGEIVVGTVARINEIKNMPLLVEAVARLRQTHNARLVIAGEGPHAEAVHAAARAHNMEAALLMPGFLPDPQNYIGHFDIFALSSNSEQFPISLVEAMAAGLPCATTDVGDCKDMLCQANKAFVTPVGDAAALAQSLQRLADDGALRHSIGAANRADALRRFSFDAMMFSYANLYGTVAGRAFPA